MVQPLGLLTGMLAGGVPVGVEPETRTGASARTDAATHHRVCSRHLRASQTDCHPSYLIRSCLWIRSPCHRHPPRKAGRFTGGDFPLQPDGTLRCPAGQKLIPQERRREADGSLRVVYAASIRSCRPCPLREQCQWNGSATTKPRQGSRLLHPLGVGHEPLLWQDWSRRTHRRACIHLLRSQRIEVQVQPPGSDVATSPVTSALLSRAERAHTRLAWESRLARNAHPEPAGRVTIKLFGIPEGFAISLGRAPA
jgi:hypothetical protein